MTNLAPYAKAITGALVAAIAIATPLVDDGLTASEWLTIVGAFLAGLGFVYAVPNRDPKAKHQAESVQPPDDHLGGLQGRHRRDEAGHLTPFRGPSRNRELPGKARVRARRDEAGESGLVLVLAVVGVVLLVLFAVGVLR